MNVDITRDIDFVKSVVVDNILFSDIKPSLIHGFGLFATEPIKKDSIVGILDGQIMPWKHYEHIENKIKNDIGLYGNYIFMEWNAIDEDTLLVRPFRTKYSYINHSYKPNLQIKYNPIRIVAIEEIKENDELTLDYSKEPLRKEYKEGHGSTYL